MFDKVKDIESAALERLTNERRTSGEFSPEVDQTLAMAGVYWDEIEKEYFQVDAFLSGINQKTVMDNIGTSVSLPS